MATVATIASPAEQRIVLSDVAWETYEQLLANFGDRRVPRFAYDQGVLEIVSPSSRHEEDGIALALVVEIVALEHDIDCRPVGSMTYRRKVLQKGFEADASFYIQSQAMVRDRDEIDPEVAPPPDLVIEIDVTNPSLDKLPIYAGLGVPEVWRCEGDRVTILVLQDGGDRESATSRAIPPLTADVLSRFLVERRSLRRTAWLRTVQAWAREQRGGDASTE
jgi:Uma2 family endonuclease